MSEDISNIRRYTNTRSQVRNLIKEFNLSRNLSVPTETLDFLRQQIDLDGTIEVTDDMGSWAGSKPIHRGYFLTFEPDNQKLGLWHKLNAPFSISIDSSFFQRNGVMHGIPLPINGPDNGLVGSVQIATGLDGVDDWIDIPHDPLIMMSKVLEGFTFHIKFAPCNVKLSNGQPVTLYAKKDPASAKGFENSVISVLMPDGSIRSKLMFEGKEYSACAYNFWDPATSEFGIQKYYDHTLRFSSIQKKLDLLVDNVQYNNAWDDINLTPYPHHDTDWHVGRSTYTNRGLFFGGLSDFRFYWDLWLKNQHNFNLFNNRITIANIAYGQSAVVGHSYITHSNDIGFEAGFEPALANGQGFISQGLLMKASPVTNDLIPVFKVTTLPKIESDVALYYSIDYNAPVSNPLELRWDIQRQGVDNTNSNDLAIVFDVGLNTGGGGGNCDPGGNQPPPQQPPPSGTEPPLNRFLSWGDNDTTPAARVVLQRMMQETNVAQYLFAGDGPYDEDATEWIEMMTSFFPADKKAKLMLTQGNHEHPESESQEAEDQIEEWFPGLNNDDDNLDWLTSKQVGNAYVISMNSQDPQINNRTGDQWNWVNAELNKAKTLRSEGKIDWIIMMVHKSWFNLLGNNQAYVTARHNYAEIVRQAQVDFMFHGHNHSYMMWKPIIAISGNNTNTGAQLLGTALADGTWDFTKDHGVIYIVNGNGGHENNQWGQAPTPETEFAYDDEDGYTRLDIKGKQATVYAVNQDGEVLHTMKVTRGVDATTNTTTTPAATLPPCEPPPTDGGTNPPPPVQPLVPIGIVGDTDGSTPDTIYPAMKNKAIVQAVHVGDFTYDSSASGDITQMNLLGTDLAGTNALIAIGNHDHSNEDGNSTVQNQIQNYFGLDSTFNKAKQVYNTYWIMLNSQDSSFSSSSGAQFTWAKARLQEAKSLRDQGKIRWICVCVHKPFICAPSDHPADEEGGRGIYQPLFNEFQVDFVFSGHNHLLEMSEPLSGTTTVQADKIGEVYDFSKTHGQVYIISGAGGRARDSHGSKPTHFRFVNDSTYGWVLFTVDETGYKVNIKFYNQGATSILHEANFTKAPQTQPPPGGGGGGNPPPTGMDVDADGIGWMTARGQIGKIPRTRNESDDKRWSGNVDNMNNGYSVVFILTAGTVASDGHVGLKHWGPNHCGDCGHSEGGDCCCWYDFGCRPNGNIYTEIERPHPNNDNVNIPLLVSNIGRGLANNTTAFQWSVYPLQPNGSADEGGIKLDMWVDTTGLDGSGRPKNNWVHVLDYTDNGAVLGDYPNPDFEHDIEIRNSGTNPSNSYPGNNIVWRRKN